jgi:hypothetical protein
MLEFLPGFYHAGMAKQDRCLKIQQYFKLPFPAVMLELLPCFSGQEHG